MKDLANSRELKAKHTELLLECQNGVSLLSPQGILHNPKLTEPLKVTARYGLRKLFWDEVRAHEPSPLGRSSSSQVNSSSNAEEE